jgi:predicted N-acetyltransferase YhbS
MKEKYFVVSADKNRTGEISQAAVLYCDVWREWPWLENQWTVAEIAQEIGEVAGDAETICFFGKLSQGVVAFSWGSFVSCEQLRSISGVMALDYISQETKKVFYLSELGVDIMHRQEGIGAEISEKLIESASRRGVQTFILRTDIKAFPARKLYAKLGFVELPIFDQKHQWRSYWLKTN